MNNLVNKKMSDLMILSKTLPMMKIFFAALLLLAISSTNTALVNACSSITISPLCQKATSNKALCSVITKNAMTWSEAMTNALNFELDYVKAGQTIVEDDLSSQLSKNMNIMPEVAQNIASDCRQANQEVARDLNTCLGFVKSDPIGSLPVVIQQQSFNGCTNHFDGDDVPEPSDLASYIDMFSKSNEVLLALASTRPKDTTTA